MSNLCEVDGEINVGETQMIKFSSNRPVKSTRTASQSLVKPALTVLSCTKHIYLISDNMIISTISNNMAIITDLPHTHSQHQPEHL